MSQFYIMKAYHLTTSGRKLGLKKICKDEPDCTIVIAQRHLDHFGDRKVPVFIIGCRSDYGVQAGDKTTYTVDTGNGYRDKNKRLEIEGVLTVIDGQIQEEMKGKMDARYTFVMK